MPAPSEVSAIVACPLITPPTPASVTPSALLVLPAVSVEIVPPVLKLPCVNEVPLNLASSFSE